jgi:RNA polymerase sigma-70 factor (ECF subfamily)
MVLATNPFERNRRESVDPLARKLPSRTIGALQAAQSVIGLGCCFGGSTPPYSGLSSTLDSVETILHSSFIQPSAGTALSLAEGSLSGSGKEGLVVDSQMTLLVLEAQAGSRVAFGSLVEAFYGVIYAVVLRRLRNHAEAAEVTQDVFLRALRKLPQLREPERFAGWLKRIAIRLSINRAVRRPPEFAQDPEVFGGCESEDRGSAHTSAVRFEQAEEVRQGIRQLRQLDRETLEAFYFEGQSLKEMSDRFDSPVGTIKRRLHTARSRLKAVLGDRQPV